MDDRNREDLKKFREELVLCLRWKNIVILKNNSKSQKKFPNYQFLNNQLYPVKQIRSNRSSESHGIPWIQG